MRYIYEALLMDDYGGGIYAYIPDIPACGVHASDYYDALYRLSEQLEETLSDMLCRGEELPEASYGRAADEDINVVTLVVNASDEARYRVVSASQAAEMLGVSRARISQMLKSGILQGYRSGRDSWVYVESIERRLDALQGYPMRMWQQ